jgi:hypothetical protein
VKGRGIAGELDRSNGATRLRRAGGLVVLRFLEHVDAGAASAHEPAAARVVHPCGFRARVVRVVQGDGEAVAGRLHRRPPRAVQPVETPAIEVVGGDAASDDRLRPDMATGRTAVAVLLP